MWLLSLCTGNSAVFHVVRVRVCVFEAPFIKYFVFLSFSCPFLVLSQGGLEVSQVWVINLGGCWFDVIFAVSEFAAGQKQLREGLWRGLSH